VTRARPTLHSREAMPGAALPGPSASEWDRLALLTDNVFATRDWSECWWEHFGRGGTARVLIDDEARPSVILPMYESGGLLRQLRLIGHGPADQLGPVCDPRHLGLAGRMLEDWLRLSSSRWDVMVLHDVCVGAPWVPEQAHEIRRVASPYVRVPVGSWEDLLAGRSRNFRQQVRRKSARLARDFSVVFRLASADTLRTDLDTLFLLHTRRWGSRAAFANGAQRRFHEDFAARALERGWLRLWILEADGRPAGAMHGFRFGGADYFQQGGWDPALDDYSPGFLLCVNAVRAAVEDGMAEFRLLRGDERYKYRFADADRPVRSVALPSSVKGLLATKAAQRRARS
jgi:CelD/BcsL family acetyltransferase involved in cellulose biosynthesis